MPSQGFGRLYDHHGNICRFFFQETVGNYDKHCTNYSYGVFPCFLVLSPIAIAIAILILKYLNHDLFLNTFSFVLCRRLVLFGSLV